MRRLPLYANAARAVFKRDLALFTSYRMRFVTTMFSTLVTLTLFYYVSRLVTSPRTGSPDAYYGFVVVGIAVFALLTSTLSLPIATLSATPLTVPSITRTSMPFQSPSSDVIRIGWTTAAS